MQDVCPNRLDIYREILISVKRYMPYIGVVGAAVVKGKHGGQCLFTNGVQL